MVIKLIYTSFFIASIIAIRFSNARDQYCYMEDKNPYLYFSSTTAYESVRAKEIKTLSECNAIYKWALIRHGTRFMTKMKKCSKEVMTVLRNEIVTNHEVHKRGKLCDSDLQSLKRWTYKWNENMNGELAPQGETDMTNLAARLKKQFNHLLSVPAEKIKFETSSVPRVKDSSQAFIKELFKIRPTEQSKINVLENNRLLRFLDKKDRTDADDVEYKKFVNSTHVTKIISEVSERLGFEEPLSFKNFSSLYTFCAFENAWELQSRGSFCASFTPEHLQIMEYAEDLHHYYTIGYGNKLNAKLAIPLARDLFMKLEAVTKNKTSEKATVYFGHSQTIVPLITKFGLFRDKESLRSDTYEKLKETRQWRTSFIDPFAANFIAVLYKCDTEYKVIFYNNEHIINFPSCQNGTCNLEMLRNKFEDELKEDEISSTSKSSKLFTSFTIPCYIVSLALYFSTIFML